MLGGTAQVVYGNQNWSTGVTGTSPNMLIVANGTCPREDHFPTMT